MLADVGERVVQEGAADEFDAFSPLGLVLGRVDFEGAQGEGGVAASGAEFDAAVGEDVLGRDAFGHAQCVVHPCR
ncbi:hypothetical protein SAZ11_46605 [Streptomyces sp. FXJ1.4098]|nr:hypothetical protein [Streptomyces sp. FXJ1.4098]